MILNAITAIPILHHQGFTSVQRLHSGLLRGDDAGTIPTRDLTEADIVDISPYNCPEGCELGLPCPLRAEEEPMSPDLTTQQIKELTSAITLGIFYLKRAKLSLELERGGPYKARIQSALDAISDGFKDAGITR